MTAKFVASRHEHHMGRKVGDGHCVAFVRDVTTAPHTSLWRRGDPVRGSGCARGTLIATFEANGTYSQTGRGHTAILLSENSDGLLVADQWVGQEVHERVIQFRGGKGNPVNDGDCYYTVEL